eukprot:GEMP01096301.1.p1 GENE.GEMP01096301.1~~GEMP01096301.1.p1  ORF type:complete len:112 (-),score=10.10 GEMP01096301.1:32-367(-)
MKQKISSVIFVSVDFLADLPVNLIGILYFIQQIFHAIFQRNRDIVIVQRLAHGHDIIELHGKMLDGKCAHAICRTTKDALHLPVSVRNLEKRADSLHLNASSVSHFCFGIL